MVQKIEKLVFAESVMPWAMIRKDGSPTETTPIVFAFFLLRTDAGNILVDTGCEHMDTFPLYGYRPPVSVLEQAGVRPEEIAHVILTHGHHDHVACTGYYPQAVVHIHEEALAGAKKYLENNLKLHVFTEDFALQDGLRVAWIGGHSPGSCVVECDLNGCCYVLCGDECYHRYNLENKEPTATACCWKHSQAFIEKYTQDGYVCLLTHEKEETGK